MSNSKVVYIEVSVGALPEWYDEGQHDHCLEQAIRDNWTKNPAYADAEIQTVYNYSTDNAVVKAYNEDGDPVFERDDHDLTYAFDYTKKHC